MSAIEIIAASIFYTLIGVRTGFVYSRVSIRIGDPCMVCSFIMGLLWPLVIVIIGFYVSISGNAGEYDSMYKVDKATQ